MSDIDRQILGRIWLLHSAEAAIRAGLSMETWMSLDTVLTCCKQCDIQESLLEHIGHWVWNPDIRR